MTELSKPSASVSLLERLTGLVLILVMLAIGWMVIVTLVPTIPHIMSIEAEVIVMVALLFASLILVSVVALIHTKR